ncbi:Cof-type HAD-IIB family hydrolase [Lacticaseibacillus daqingensis]|uniref:Cof-type HAD-IIB family hydrolase n=1 Tax=Lacticaseibacillus daqingensis TaxID=2486014 RepID=UPI000F79D8F8|nr:Cof-type HAD-IIB family hydrolase [Lacticaseibacillus daqingensis]
MTQAIVFFDLGGTLLTSRQQVQPSALAAIKQLQANEILPVIATGKSLFAIQPLLALTGIDTVVSANGSNVQYRGRTLVNEVVPQRTVQAVSDFATAQGDPIAWYTPQACGVSQPSPETRAAYRAQGLTPAVTATWADQRAINFMFVFNRDRDALYQQAFAETLTFVRNSHYGLDTMRAGVSKRSGIAHLLQHAALAGVPTYGFGDALNDLEMLDQLAHPIVMGNGSDAAKAHAAYITGTNDADGIAQGLRHFGLI